MFRTPGTLAFHTLRRIRHYRVALFLPLLSAVLVSGFTGSAVAASNYSAIHRFKETGPVGVTPTYLVSDGAGNFYGITTFGGKYRNGAVYQLSFSGQSWVATVIYNPDGVPGPLIADKSGNVYGVVTDGGRGCGRGGCGFVYKLSPPKIPGGAWTHARIFLFDGWNGWSPGGLALDQAGNVYGTTYGGGRYCGGRGCGLVYKLTPPPGPGPWKMHVLHYFTGVLGNDGDGDGAHPGSIAFVDQGTLYGLASGGGHCDGRFCGGAAFSLTSAPGQGEWNETILYRFNFDGADYLSGGITLAGPGVIYGTSGYSLFQLSSNGDQWSESVLASGDTLYGQVAVASNGTLYSTSFLGPGHPSGTLFSLTPSGNTWKYTLLHAFDDGIGQNPESGVVVGQDGNLYGTTTRGGSPEKCGLYGLPGCGVVFEFVPQADIQREKSSAGVER